MDIRVEEEKKIELEEKEEKVTYMFYLSIIGQFLKIFLLIIVLSIFNFESIYEKLHMDGTSLIFTIIMIWFIIKKRKWIKEEIVSVDKYIFNKKEILIIVFSMFFIDEMISYFLYFTGDLTNLILEYREEMQSTNLWSYIHVLIYAPILEEFFFRSYIQKNLVKLHRYKIGIFITSLLFGLIHIIPLQVLGAGLGSLVYGYIAYKSGNIKLVVILHFVNNLISVFLEKISVPNEIVFVDMLQGTVMSILIMGIYYFVISYYSNREKKRLYLLNEDKSK